MYALRLGLDVHQFRNAGLHAVSHFILADAGRDFRVADVVEGELVQILDRIDDHLALLTGHALGIREVENGVTLGAEFNPLVDGGKEAAAPRAVAGSEDLAGDKNDEARQVLIFARGRS